MVPDSKGERMNPDTRTLALEAVGDKISASLYQASARLMADTVEDDYGDLVDAWLAARPDLEPHRIADEVLSGEQPPPSHYFTWDGSPSRFCAVCGKRRRMHP